MSTPQSDSYIDPFSKARLEWKKSSVNQFIHIAFGDLYVRRYPMLKMSETASQISSSILEGDDSVHAFSAEGVRSTIIKRIIQGEKRGYIRPWYTEAGLWAENSRVLKALSEEDLHFLVVENFIYPEGSSGKFKHESDKMIGRLDPEELKKLVVSGKKITWKQAEYEIELNVLKYSLFDYLRPQIEFFAVLKGMERSLYPLTRVEFEAIADILLDPEKADDVLRKRFYEGDKSKARPLLGENHRELQLHTNFTVKYLGSGNPEFYTIRSVVLWIYSLLIENERANQYFSKKKAMLFDEIPKYCQENNMTYNDLIWQALEYAKFEKIVSNMTHMLRTEYAGKANFRHYASELYHLLHQRKKAMSIFEKANYPIKIETAKYEETNLLIELGQKMIDSILDKLQSQIPIPRGASPIHTRAIVAKRKSNLEKEVAGASIRQEIIAKVLGIRENYEKETDQPIIEKKLRFAYDTLMPRGKIYFEEMETRMNEIKEELGTVDMAEEYSDLKDNPQSLVRQFGPEAQRLARQFFDDPENIEYSEFYNLIASMKSVQLLFDEATINVLRRNKITASMMDELFKPQIELIKDLYQEQQAIKSIVAGEISEELTESDDSQISES